MEKLEWVPEIEIVKLGNPDLIRDSEILDEDELPPWVIQ